MWARLADELLDHRKIYEAGAHLGTNGPGLALSIYVVGLLYSCRHLTDGHLPRDVVRHFRHVAKPLVVADALVQAGLWETNGHGFQIHDFLEFGNPTAADVKAKRAKERQRKASQRAYKRGG